MLSLLTLRVLSVLQSVHAVLEEANQSCNQWTQLSESVEQRVAGLHDSVEVLRVTALAEKQKGEASKPAVVVLERTIADLQAQLAGEKKSHQLTQVLCPLHSVPGCTPLCGSFGGGGWAGCGTSTMGNINSVKNSSTGLCASCLCIML